MIEYAKVLWDVAKGLYDVRADLSKARKDRRAKLAEYMAELAALIEVVAASLRANKYPHGSCAELHTRGQLMAKTLKGLVSEEEAQRFQADLLQVWEIERLFDQLQKLPAAKAEKKLVELEHAAGYFRGIAAHMKVVSA